MWLIFGVVCLLANIGTFVWNAAAGSAWGMGFAIIGIVCSVYIIATSPELE